MTPAKTLRMPHSSRRLPAARIVVRLRAWRAEVAVQKRGLACFLLLELGFVAWRSHCRSSLQGHGLIQGHRARNPGAKGSYKTVLHHPIWDPICRRGRFRIRPGWCGGARSNCISAARSAEQSLQVSGLHSSPHRIQLKRGVPVTACAPESDGALWNLMPEGWNPAIMTMSKHAGSTVLTMPGKASKLKSAPRNRFRDFSRCRDFQAEVRRPSVGWTALNPCRMPPSLEGKFTRDYRDSMTGKATHTRIQQTLQTHSHTTWQHISETYILHLVA